MIFSAFSRLAAVAVMVFALLAPGLHAEQASPAALDKLNKHIGALNRELRSDTDQRGKQRDALKKTELAVARKQKEIRQINERLAEQQSRLDSLLSQEKELHERKAAQQTLIEKQILEAYKIGRQSKLKMLLNQENPEQLARALAYYNYFNEARLAQIREYVATLEELQQVAPAIHAETDALKTSRDKLARQREELRDHQRNRAQALAKLDKTIADKNQQLAVLQENRDKMKQLLQSMQKAVAHIPVPADYLAFHKARGHMPWPARGKLTNSFGNRRSRGKLRWQGVTIAAKAGSPVSAIHHGRVVYADWFRGAGLLLILDHGDGYMSLYAHNETLTRDIGDWVTVGEQIATVGNSGGQQQAGLYFEIRHNSEPQNPKKWCSKNA
jgi:septal ring factor EnvC (AmiA/AmiB activator)